MPLGFQPFCLLPGCSQSLRRNHPLGTAGALEIVRAFGSHHLHAIEGHRGKVAEKIRIGIDEDGTDSEMLRILVWRSERGRIKNSEDDASEEDEDNTTAKLGQLYDLVRSAPTLLEGGIKRAVETTTPIHVLTVLTLRRTLHVAQIARTVVLAL